MQFLNNLNLVQNELQNARVHNLADAPAGPVTGQLYYNTTNDELYYYDGSGWVASGSVAFAGDATITTINPDDTAAAGASSDAARGDHRHGIVTSAPGASAVGDGAAEGTATAFSRADHQHAREGFGAVTDETAFGGASANGSATTVSRSDHAHGTPAHGASQHSSFSLSTFAAPTADLSIGNFKLTSVADPVNAQDAATKAYVDATAQGMDVKESVRVATTANVDLATGGLLTIDGVTVAEGDRVLVKDQTTASENGVYEAASGAWSRAPDFDEDAEVTAGAFTFVEEGTAQADSGWVLTADDPITVGTDALTFAQFSGAGQIDAGDGLTKSGSTLNVGAGDGITVGADTVGVTFADAEPGSVSPTGGAVGAGTQAAREDHSHDATVGTPTGLNPDGGNAAGTADSLARSDHRHATPAAPPTSTLSPGDTNSEGASTSFSRADHSHAVDASIPRKFSASVGDGASTAITVTHNLGTRDVQVTVYEAGTPYAEVLCDVEHTDANSVTLRFATAPATDAYRAVVVG